MEYEALSIQISGRHLHISYIIAILQVFVVVLIGIGGTDRIKNQESPIFTTSELILMGLWMFTAILTIFGHKRHLRHKKSKLP